MRWHVSVTNVGNSRLRVRTGPGLSYRIVDWVYQGNTGIVVDSKTVSGRTWYKWEDTGYWSCGIQNNGTKYLTMLYDLEVKPEPTPAPEPKEPVVEIDLPKIGTPVGGYKNGSNNTSGIGSEKSWYQPMTFTEGNYAPVDDSIIAKNIAALKHNMDISYTTSDDIYDGYLKISDAKLGYSNGSKGYYTSLQKKLYNSFNRNKTAFPDKELNKTFAYVFFTRPDLNILTSGSSANSLVLTDQTNYDMKYKYIYKNNPWSLKSLVQAGNSHHKFMVLLSNEALSYEVGDVVIKTVEHGETYNGNKIIYGFSDQESNAAGEMSIRYRDTVNLDIYKLHMIWVDYINKVSRGIFAPKNTYLKERILDYAVSCYYFLCGADGSTILYWQKLTGVFPVNTGENVFSWDSGTLLAKPEINIKYMYAFKSAMDMYSLYEFNELTDSSQNPKKTYEELNCMTGSTLTHAPRVWETVDSAGNKIFRLMWVEN